MEHIIYRPHRRLPTADARFLRILCVDDNRDLADSEALLLEIVGFEATACYDGDSALSLIPVFRPAVCLIDLNMPRMCGDELLARMKQKEEGRLPVMIAVTAKDDPESCNRIRAAGFDSHLIKPIDPAALLAFIGELRGEPRKSSM